MNLRITILIIKSMPVKTFIEYNWSIEQKNIKEKGRKAEEILLNTV